MSLANLKRAVVVILWSFVLTAHTAPDERVLAIDDFALAAEDPFTLAPGTEIPGSFDVVLDERAPINQRLKAVNGLGNELEAKELEKLCAYLKAKPAVDPLTTHGIRTLKNDILNVLREQEAVPPSLTDTLISLAEDREQDAVVRDYAVQHLAFWHQQGGKDKDESRIEVALQEQLKENTSIAGTALLALHRLSQRGAALDDGQLNAKALAMARSTETAPATRITAIQVCAERDLQEILPIVQSLAVDSPNRSLRLSAIAAVGKLGGRAQVEFLRKLQQDQTLQPTVRLSLEQLSRKLQLF